MTTEILLTNDDGIDAVGIRALADALSRDYDVTVVAPASNQSGVGGARSWWDTTVEYTETDAGYAVGDSSRLRCCRGCGARARPRRGRLRL